MKKSAVKWSEAKLGDLFTVKHGYAFKGKFFSDHGPFIVLTPGNFHDAGGFKHKGGKEKYYIGDFPKTYLLRKNDLIVAMTEQAEGLLGSSALVPKSNLYLHNQRLGLLQNLAKDRLDKYFLYYLFNHIPIRAAIRASASGTKVRHTSPSRIYEVPVSLPTVPEQRRIASILSAYDDLIENNTRRIAILEEMARRLYQEWFVHFRFPGHEKVKMVESELGPIPEGWTNVPFNEVAGFVNGYAFKPSQWAKNGTPIIKIKELKGGVTDQTPRYNGPPLDKKYQIKNGDILFSWSANLDVYLWSQGPGWLNQHLFQVRPTSGTDKIHLYHALKERMPMFRAQSGGTTMKHIKRSALKEVKFTLPPENIRKRFVAFASPVASLVLNLQSKNVNLRTQRDLLLPKLISGEIDVSAMDAASIEQEAA